MITATEEKRIVVAKGAIADERVAELLRGVAYHLSMLQQYSKAGVCSHSRGKIASFFRRASSCKTCYQGATEELCRLSRKTIWRFVNSVCCCPQQVEAAAELFEQTATKIDPDAAQDPELVKDFKAAIKNRSAQLRLALDDFNDFGTEEESVQSIDHPNGAE